MTIPLELIKILDAIDRNGSFEAAAQELHKVRSALTYTIHQYEQRTKVQLFNRDKYRAKFTQAGRLLLDEGRELLLLNSRLEENVKLVAKGWQPVVRIAYDEVLNPKPLLELMGEFQRHYPQVNVEIFSEILNGCTDALIKQHVDIAIGVSGRLPSRKELSFEPLGKSKFVFAVSPLHPLAKVSEPISALTLSQYPAIFTRDSAQRFTTDSMNKLHEKSYLTFSSLDLKRQAHIAGLGVGFLPLNFIRDNIKKGELIIKKVKKTKPETLFYLGWNNEKETLVKQWLIQKILESGFVKQLF